MLSMPQGFLRIPIDRSTAQAVSYALHNLTSPAMSPDRHHFQPQSLARNLHFARRRIAICQYVTRKLKRPNGATARAFLVQPFTAGYRRLHTVAQTPEVHEICNYPVTNETTCPRDHCDKQHHIDCQRVRSQELRAKPSRSRTAEYPRDPQN